MFIDYVTLMLVSMGAGLLVLAFYLLVTVPRQDQRAWALALLPPAAVALLCGLHVCFTWPLPGAYNIAFGEPSVLLGVALLAIAWGLWRGFSLAPVAIYLLPVSLAAVVIGARIVGLGLTRSPLLSGAGFILTGGGGALFALNAWLRARTLRTIAGCALVGAACIWLFIGYMAYWGHLESFGQWQPYQKILRETPQ